MGTNGNYQSAEEWMAANKTPKYAEDIQNQLEEIKDSIKILRSSQADFKEKMIELIEVPPESTAFPHHQAAVFSLAGMLVGILLSFLVFRKMVKKVKKDYESRLSEERVSLERMIKIMSERQQAEE